MTGIRCCVKGCRSTSHGKNKKLDHGLRFHSIPALRLAEGPRVAERTKRRRRAWVSALRLPEITVDSPRSAKVCSRHFLSGKPAYEMSDTDPDWAPSLHMGHNEIDMATETEQFARQKETAIGSRQAAVEETAVDETAAVEENAVDETAAVEETAVDETAQTEAVQTPLEEEDEEEEEAGGTGIYGSAAKMPLMRCDECVSSYAIECHLCVNWRAEINRLLEENRDDDVREKRKLDAQYFEDDDLKVKYYTGLPNLALVMAVLATILPYLPAAVKVLTPFQMLILTLMRLRHNMPIIRIAQLFNVVRTTVSRTFSDTISVLHARLNSLVHWPRRVALQRSMPPLFEEAFGERVAIILDCFELVTMKPYNLINTHKPRYYLDYKQNKTTKYLIGVTPQGRVSFISKGWRGCISDKHVTENSGILDKLLPGDLLLAANFDNGVGMMCAEVKMIPSSTNGPCHLDIKYVEATQQMAHLRTYVEGVIGTIHNKYTVLADKIPLSMVLPIEGEDLTFLDKMLSVCCALTNLCGSDVAEH